MAIRSCSSSGIAVAGFIQPVDPLGGQKQTDGTIITPLMSFQESMNQYPPTR